MAIKKIEIRPKGDGTYPDVLYPKTSTDQVDGLTDALNARATAQQGLEGSNVYGRFQERCKPITSWNSTLTNGMYMGMDLPDAPSSGWFMGTVTSHADGYVVQRVTSVTSTDEYTRRRLANVWTPWQMDYKSRSQRTFDVDLNTFKTNGVFALGTGISNMPPAQDWGTLVVSTSGDVTVQTLYGINGHIFHRTNTLGVGWIPWNTIGHPSVNVESLFNSVSNGKSAVANAITQKGVATSATAEFATMANNIMAIAGGRKYATGVTLADGGGYMQVRGLDFIPAIIGAWIHRSNGSEATFGLYVGNSTSNVGYNVNAMSVSGYNSFGGFTALNGGFNASMGSQSQYGWVAIGY